MTRTPDAERQRASRAKGRTISITLRDPRAIAALDQLRLTHGIRGAIEHALIQQHQALRRMIRETLTARPDSTKRKRAIGRSEG